MHGYCVCKLQFLGGGEIIFNDFSVIIDGYLFFRMTDFHNHADVSVENAGSFATV